MENQHEKELIDKYLAGLCTPQEKETIESWYLARAKERQDKLGELEDADYAATEKEIWDAINRQTNPKVKPLWPRLFVAASIFLFTGICAYFIINKQPRQQTQQVAQNQVHDLAPGGNKAILTLANGKQIVLTNAKNGLLANQGNIHIRKTNDGSVLYDARGGESNTATVAYNTISTPRGGKYIITLADGTEATLDALSSIRFPTAFNGNSREVTITGQVYFEVAHNAAKPFRVTTKGQTVEVLGTHFNINAYDDNAVIKTTLLQGSIRISRNGESALLKPGEQAQIKIGEINSKINVIQADTEEAVAWKNGFFQFDGSDTRSVMNELARWYDVEVQYEGTIPERSFSGKIYRNVNASQALKILSLAKVHFKIEDKKIIVTN